MLKLARPANVLVLQGLKLEEFSRKQPVAAQMTTYDAIPTRMIGTQEGARAWTYTRTNLKCWECALPCESWPKFIPTHPTQEMIGGVCADVWKPLGCFCEWTCVSRYISACMPRNQQYDHIAAVCLVEALFSGTKRLILPEALPRTVMRSFCGESGLLPNEFREKNMAIWNSQVTTNYQVDKIPKHANR